MAMIQWAHEKGLQDCCVVYCDTRWASSEWAERITLGEELARKYGFSTSRIESMGMQALVRMKSGFPMHGSQFCTAWLKGFPFLNWIDDIDTNNSVVVMIGKRRAESEDRKNVPEFVDSSEYHGGRAVWHPLFMHSDMERDELLTRAGVKKLNHRSDECSPCTNANRNDLRRLSSWDIGKLGALEREVGQPMFRAGKHAGAHGIQQVIQWAKYSPGQYKPGQDDLFESGCGSPFGCGL